MKTNGIAITRNGSAISKHLDGKRLPPEELQANRAAF